MKREEVDIDVMLMTKKSILFSLIVYLSEVNGWRKRRKGDSHHSFCFYFVLVIKEIIII